MAGMDMCHWMLSCCGYRAKRRNQRKSKQKKETGTTNKGTFGRERERKKTLKGAKHTMVSNKERERRMFPIEG